MSDATPTATLSIDGVINLRDAGGQPSEAGRSVRSGVLFRSGQLDHADDAAIAAFAALGISVVFDLRTESERELLPDRLPDGVELRHLDVLAGADTSLASHLADLFTDTSAAEELLRSGDIADHYLSTYRQLVSLDSARAAYRELFATLAEHDGAALFHCTAGKDRTGWAAASLLTLLGVDDESVDRDYLRSSDPVVASFRPMIDEFAAAGGDPELLIPVFEVERSYLDAARTEMTETFGSIEGYFTDGLGLDAAVQERLRERFLGVAPG